MNSLVPDYILRQYAAGKLRGRFKAAALFVDIAAFTAMTQSLMANGKQGAEVLSDMINAIYTPAISAIYANNGFVSTFAGDAFTAVFPYKNVSPAAALQAAYAVQDIFARTGKRDTRFGTFQLSVRIGAAYGDVHWGIITSETRLCYYFKGQAIEACAQCEHTAAKGQVVLTGSLLSKVAERVQCARTAAGFYLLKAITTPAPVEQSKRIGPVVSDGNFVQDAVLQLRSPGEFRTIIACFISLQPTRAWRKAVSAILTLTADYGGYFNVLNFGDKGGNILVLFGAPIMREKLFQRACEFALAAGHLANIRTRLGLACGTVFAGFIGSSIRKDYTALGLVVNLAARFMMKARWRAICIDGKIHSNVSGTYHTERLKSRRFKGFDGKVPVYLLKNRRASTLYFSGALTGREKELQQLLNRLQPLKQGVCGGVIYVHGAAGIGKSRLVAELKHSVMPQAGAAAPAPFSWFRLPCDEILRKSFNPFVSFLSVHFDQREIHRRDDNKRHFEHVFARLVAHTSRASLRAELVRLKSFLAALLGITWAGSLYERLDARARYDNTVHALRTLICAESLYRPVVMQIEDAQWLDADSRHVLEVITEGAQEFPFLVITTCRPRDDGSRVSFTLQDVKQYDITLQHLNREHTQRLASAILHGRPGTGLTELIWAKSEGNPFYIEQLLAYLEENRLLNKHRELTQTDIPIPGNITGIIVARIDRLHPDAKELVHTASVLGREFAVTVVAHMLGKQSIRSELAQGEKARIWHALSADDYLFSHALIHETAYQMQLKKRLLGLHKQAAETMETLFRDNLERVLPELADHYEKAEQEQKAVTYLQKAAAQARAGFKNAQAIAFYDRLLGHAISHPTRTDALLKKCRIYELTGQWQAAEANAKEAMALAEQAGEWAFAAEACLFLGRLYYLTGDYRRATGMYQKQLRISRSIGDARKTANALTNMGIVQTSTGAYERAGKHLQQALQICERIGDTVGQAETIGCIGLIHRHQGDYPRAVDCLEQQMALCEANQDKRNLAYVYGNLGDVYCFQGHYERALTLYNQKLALCREMGYTDGIANVYGNMGVVHFYQSDYEKALGYFKQKLTLCERLGNKREIADAVGNIGIVYEYQQAFGQAMACYQIKLATSRELDDMQNIANALNNIGNIHCKQCAYDKALACFLDAQKIGERLGDKRTLANIYGNIGLVYYHQGKLVSAHAYLNMQLDLCEKLADGFCKANALINRGKVFMEEEKYADALPYFSKAIEICLALKLSPQLLEAYAANTEVLYRLHRLTEAVACNQKTLALATECNDHSRVFYHTMFARVLDYRLLHQETQRITRCVRPLEAMLVKQQDEVSLAQLHYYLYVMKGELTAFTPLEENAHRKKSLALLRKLYKQEPKRSYKAKIDELMQP